jgi:hypothetical protein
LSLPLKGHILWLRVKSSSSTAMSHCQLPSLWF